MRILAVDDDDIFLEMLQKVLTSYGYTDATFVQSARAAADAVETARTPFDCFLLDIQMPEVDGIYLCRWIRRQPQYAMTPILMITAMAERHYVESAFAAGATDYVNKPLDVLELSTRIRLANRIRKADRRIVESHEQAKALEDRVSGSGKVNVSEPRRIQNIDGAIDFLAMENYLLQLSRTGMISKTALGFHMPHVADICAAVTSVEFDFLLADVAEAITDNLKQVTRLVAYAGSGNFVCIVESGSPPDRDALQDAVQTTMWEMGVVCKGVNPAHLRVVAGTPVRLGLRNGRAAVAALYQAMASAENGGELAGGGERPGILRRLRGVSLAG